MSQSLVEPDLIVYGGGFDPPHQGHVESVVVAHEHFPLAQILIMPGFVTAAQKGTMKSSAASYEHRIAMCQLAFSHCQNTEICRLEETLPTPNFSLTTLKNLQILCPDKKLGFLLGQDQLRLFPMWYCPKEILEISSIIAVSRDYEHMEDGNLSDDVEKIAMAIASQISRDLPVGGSRTGIEAEALKKWIKERVYCIEARVVPAASQKIRDYLYSRQPVPHGWMPENILSYISQNNLYREAVK